MMTKIFKLATLFASISASLFGQGGSITVTGNQNTVIGQSYTYNVVISRNVERYDWEAYGGVKTSMSPTGAIIRWEQGGNNHVSYWMEDIFGNFYLGDLAVQTSVPNPESTHTVNATCGTTSVTRQQSPPNSYVHWFWQTSSSGTSTTLGNLATVNINSNAALYLRARSSTQPYAWSDGSQFIGNIEVTSSAPVAGTIAPSEPISICSGSAPPTIENGTSPSGHTSIQWQRFVEGSSWTNVPSNGTSLAYSPGTLTTTTSFRRSVTNICGTSYSNTKQIQVKPLPAVDASPQSQTICAETSSQVVSLSNPNNVPGTDFSWTIQKPTSISGVTSQTSGNTIPSQTLSTTSSIVLDVVFRVKPSANGCDGPTKDVTISVKPRPTNPSPGPSEICGSGTVTPTLGANANTIRWYDGIASVSPIHVGLTSPNLTSTTSFHISSYHTTTQCESARVPYAVTVSPVSAGGALGPSDSQPISATGQLNLTGHTGSIKKWQQKIGSGSWTDIAHTSASYSYSELTSSTDFRVEVKSGICPVAYSNIAVVSISHVLILVEGSRVLAPGSEKQLTALAGFHSYEWYKDGMPISGAQSNTFVATLPGLYAVKIKKNPNSSVYTTPTLRLTRTADTQQDLNYIQVTTFNISGVTSTIDLYSLHSKDYLLHTDYFDGLGRPVQGVTLGASPKGMDVVQVYSYDAFDRQDIKYLPYVHSARDGRYRGSGVSEQTDFYATPPDGVHGDTQPYAKTIFESSPLNRIVKQGAPGSSWQPNENSIEDHTIKMKHRSNFLDEVILFRHDVDGNISMHENESVRYFAPNTLYADVTIDEQGHEIIQFTDKLNRTVLRRVEHNMLNNVRQYADTYYIYDDLGNLVVVIPPEAVKALLQQ